MSYPKGLDEYTDDELREELARRRRAVASATCAYCERRIAECERKPCRFPSDPLRYGGA